MSQNLLALIALIAPLTFAVTALISWFQPGLRPMAVKKMSMISASLSIGVAAICGVLVFKFQLLETSLLGYKGLGLSLRLDSLSVLMMAMIALLGFIIIKFSLNYLDGDQRQGIFIGRLSATFASVQLLVLSGNLGLLLISWILASICIHRLLVFYSHRPGALVAAKKKFILARLGDLSLLTAIVLLYNHFGTGDLEFIFSEIRNTQSFENSYYGMELIAIFLAFSALLKSAQFPTHGWLIEVMETPTPVSALLHAGLLNAGPFLIIRMAYVMEASTYASFLLIALGGFTAIFASVVYLTQTSIKTALAYSSIAHMGFSLMVCGLGLFPAAMLHLVAHSFYKAHAFLSSGSVIDVIRGSKMAKAKASGSPFKIILGILMALGLYLAFIFVWGIGTKEVSLLLIGAIITMGLSRLFVSAIDTKFNIALILRTSILAIIVIASFFTLETGMRFLLSTQIPDLTSLGFEKSILIGTILVLFGIVVFIQILAPTLSQSKFYRAIAIHVKNGLYINAISDRTLSALSYHSPESKKVAQHQENLLKKIEISRN